MKPKKLDKRTQRTVILMTVAFVLLGIVISAASIYLRLQHPNGSHPWIGGRVTGYENNTLYMDARGTKLSVIISSSTVITHKHEDVSPDNLVGKMVNIDAKEVVDGRDIATYIRVIDAPEFPLR